MAANERRKLESQREKSLLVTDMAEGFILRNFKDRFSIGTRGFTSGCGKVNQIRGSPDQSGNKATGSN